MRQQRSTSAESTAQINILIQKLGLEVLCFIPTLTIQAVTLCQIVFSQRFVCVCVYCFDKSPDGGSFSGRCMTGKSRCLTLIKSSTFEHVSTAAHQCWLRLCMITIVIFLLATCPYLDNHVWAHAKALYPAVTVTTSPKKWLLLNLSVSGWWQVFCEVCHFHLLRGRARSMFTCRTEARAYITLVASVPSRKSMCASLMIHCLSVLLAHSLLWVQ